MLRPMRFWPAPPRHQHFSTLHSNKVMFPFCVTVCPLKRLLLSLGTYIEHSHPSSNFLSTSHPRLDLDLFYDKSTHCISFSALNRLRRVKLLVALKCASFTSHVTASFRIDYPTVICSVNSTVATSSELPSLSKPQWWQACIFVSAVLFTGLDKVSILIMCDHVLCNACALVHINEFLVLTLTSRWNK